jgi:hypothetical protein
MISRLKFDLGVDAATVAADPDAGATARAFDGAARTSSWTRTRTLMPATPAGPAAGGARQPPLPGRR